MNHIMVATHRMKKFVGQWVLFVGIALILVLGHSNAYAEAGVHFGEDEPHRVAVAVSSPIPDFPEGEGYRYWEIVDIRGGLFNIDEIVLEAQKGKIEIQRSRKMRVERGLKIPGKTSFDSSEQQASFYKFNLEKKIGSSKGTYSIEKYVREESRTVTEVFEVGKTKFSTQAGKPLPILPESYRWKAISGVSGGGAPSLVEGGKHRIGILKHFVTYQVEVNPEKVKHMEKVASRGFIEHTIDSFEVKASVKHIDTVFALAIQKEFSNKLGRDWINFTSKTDKETFLAGGRKMVYLNPNTPKKVVPTVYHPSAQSIDRMRANARPKKAKPTLPSRRKFR